LLKEDIAPKITPECSVGIDKRDFLASHCYTEEVSTMLSSYSASLVAIYNQYAVIVNNPEEKMKKPLLSAFEWLAVCDDLLPRADAAFPLRARKLCFLRSRMRIISETASRTRLTQHSFEDFLECLVRASVLIPLPTDQELVDAGCDNCWFFFKKLVAEGTAATFFASHPPPGILDARGLLQLGANAIPVARRVEHLIVHAIITIETQVATKVSEDGKVEDKEVASPFAP